MSAKGTKLSAETKKKIAAGVTRYFADSSPHKKFSEAAKIKRPPHSAAARKKISEGVKKAQASKVSAAELLSRIPPNIEAVLKDDKIEVKCASCGVFFSPTPRSIAYAKLAYENSGGSWLYCSDVCKSACPVFGFRPSSTDPRSKLYVPKTARDEARRCQTNHLKQQQCSQHGYTFCEKCGDIIDVELHHTQTVAKSGKDAINSAGHMLLCAGCHTEVHRECG